MREPVLRSGDVHADHPVVAERDHEVGHLRSAIGLPHRTQQSVHLDVAVGVETVEHGLHRLRHAQPSGRQQLGAKRTSAYTTPSSARSSAHSAATLRIASSVCMTARVLERLQIPDQGSAVGGIDEPLAQLLGVGGGQSVVTAGGGQVDDGLRSQATVEVVVQQNLGQCAISSRCIPEILSDVAPQVCGAEGTGQQVVEGLDAVRVIHEQIRPTELRTTAVGTSRTASTDCQRRRRTRRPPDAHHRTCAGRPPACIRRTASDRTTRSRRCTRR